MGFWSSIGSIGGAIVGGIFGGPTGGAAGYAIGSGIGGAADSDSAASQEIASARQTNEWQVALAREQMAWEERMSNTAHQREVEDLRKAGLNPILSANKGASTPQAIMPVVSNPKKGLAEMRLNSARMLQDTAARAMELDVMRSSAREARYRADIAKKDRDAYMSKAGTVGSYLKALGVSGSSALSLATGFLGGRIGAVTKGGSAVVRGMKSGYYTKRG